MGYRAPQAPIPDLPAPEEIVQAPIAEHIDTPFDEFEAVVFSAIDPRFDHTMLSSLQNAAESEGLLLGLSALSRISRNSDKLLRVLEFLLAHKARILTTNYLLSSEEAWTRRHNLVKPDTQSSVTGFGEFKGLSGAHKKTVQTYLRLIGGGVK